MVHLGERRTQRNFTGFLTGHFTGLQISLQVTFRSVTGVADAQYGMKESAHGEHQKEREASS